MPTAYTVCFCGTACARDEGEKTRKWDPKLIGSLLGSEQKLVSDKGIFDRDTGYIPVRIHQDISGTLLGTDLSETVRGVGENDWHHQMDSCDPLLTQPLLAPKELLDYVASYSQGNQRQLYSQASGWSMVALALHGANLAARSGATRINLLGHSRGGVAAIMAAWFLYAYGSSEVRKMPVSIFAIDPVPGTGEWYGIQTQLAPNVHNYVGIYAWDHLDEGFAAVIPRPNGRMTLDRAQMAIEDRGLGTHWWSLADNRQLADPLVANTLRQPMGYHLYACRGRHGTVAGIATRDGRYDPNTVSADVGAVPRLVYKLARAYLTQWETVFRTRCRVREDAGELRRRIHTAHTHFDTMGGGEMRTAVRTGRPAVRRVSSISGRLGWNRYYLEDVVGTPPYDLAYPCTIEQQHGGWVKWKFL
ncbi:Tat pathway signal protein [Corallococcus interemptor]|uniref:Tat pathway signal protein n=1 Tax=Corallococcus interemptor TaxID=2316720 RepID=UPI003D0138D6